MCLTGPTGRFLQAVLGKLWLLRDCGAQSRRFGSLGCSLWCHQQQPLLRSQRTAWPHPVLLPWLLLLPRASIQIMMICIENAACADIFRLIKLQR